MTTPTHSLAAAIVDLTRYRPPLVSALGTVTVDQPAVGMTCHLVSVTGVTETPLTIPRERWLTTFAERVDAHGTSLNGRTVALTLIAGIPHIVDTIG